MAPSCNSNKRSHTGSRRGTGRWPGEAARGAARLLKDEERRFVVWWGRFVCVGVFSGQFLLLLSVALPVSGSWVERAFLGFWTVLFIALVYRCSRMASIEFGDHGFVYRGMFRTYRVSYSDVSKVKTIRGSGVGWSAKVPRFELTDGTFVDAQEIRSLRRGASIVDDVVAEASSQIARRNESDSRPE